MSVINTVDLSVTQPRPASPKNNNIINKTKNNNKKKKKKRKKGNVFLNTRLS